MFHFNFVINNKGGLTRDNPTKMVGACIYELPQHICDELILANSFLKHIISCYYNPKYLNSISLINIIDNLEKLNRTDYFKTSISLYGEKIIPLDIISKYKFTSITKRILPYYTYNEIEPILQKYSTFLQPILNKISLTGLIYATDKTGALPAENIYAIADYLKSSTSGGSGTFGPEYAARKQSFLDRIKDSTTRKQSFLSGTKWFFGKNIKGNINKTVSRLGAFVEKNNLKKSKKIKKQ